MRLTRVISTALVLAALALAALSAAPPSSPLGPAEAEAGCGSVAYRGRSYIMFRQNVGCRFAKLAIRRLATTGRKPRGYRCTSGSRFKTGGFCRDGARQFGWHPGD